MKCTVLTLLAAASFSGKHALRVALGHSAAHSSSQRLFHFLGSAHDLEALAAGRSAGSAVRALLLGHWLHLATVLCWLTGIAAHAGFQANLDLWLDNPVRFGSIAHALWDPHFGSTAFPVNELPASGFPFWARSVGFVAGGQLLAFGGALEAGALWAGSAVNKNLHPFRCSAALPSALSLLWAGHLGWAAAAPRPAQLLSLVGDLSPLSRAVLLTDTIHHHVAVAAIGLWVSAAWHFFRVTLGLRPAQSPGRRGLPSLGVYRILECARRALAPLRRLGSLFTVPLQCAFRPPPLGRLGAGGRRLRSLFSCWRRRRVRPRSCGSPVLDRAVSWVSRAGHLCT